MVDSTNNANENPVIEGVVVDDTQTWVSRKAQKHPRLAKILAITGVIGTGVGVVLTARTIQANKSHLDAAGDHLSEAAHELTTSVTPQSQEA